MALIDPESIAETFTELGFCTPISVFSEQHAAAYREQLETLETRLAGEKVGNKAQLNYPHVIFEFANRIVRSPQVLDPVERILGPDIMVWGSTFFIKEPHSDSYVSWHQDLRYWGLADDEAVVSAWLALSPVNRANGCMRFAPGSHRQALVRHKDTFSGANFLTRGQEADVEIDESRTVNVELRPGQMSLHHGPLLHASAPNGSHQRRIGLVMNFVAPHNRQVVGKKDFAMLVRGKDRYGHFEAVPAPNGDLSPDSLAWHAAILAAQNDALYDGAAQA